MTDRFEMHQQDLDKFSFSVISAAQYPKNKRYFRIEIQFNLK